MVYCQEGGELAEGEVKCLERLFDLPRRMSANLSATLTQAYLDISLAPIGGEREVDRHVTKQDTQLV